MKKTEYEPNRLYIPYKTYVFGDTVSKQRENSTTGLIWKQKTFII
jgi:hypothetical protein